MNHELVINKFQQHIKLKAREFVKTENGLTFKFSGSKKFNRLYIIYNKETGKYSMMFAKGKSDGAVFPEISECELYSMFETVIILSKEMK